MKKNPKKLKLHRETLQALDQQEVSKAVGASYTCSAIKWCPSISYCVVCREA